MATQQSKEIVVNDAVRALLYEVTVNPKPGLVDPTRSGAHPDMDAFDFIDSALCLQPYFEKCFAAGAEFHEEDLRHLFSIIRGYGIVAEKEMFKTTSGLNTHKGAIFSLGILVTAVGYQQGHGEFLAQELPAIVQKMLVGMVEHDFANTSLKKEQELTAGERQFVKYGITGIRGEAAAGFPAVFEYGFPYLCETKGIRNERLVDTFMKIVSCTQDSNLIKRAGSLDIVAWAQRQAAEFLELGGSSTRNGSKKIRELDEIFTTKKLSLGGSADLLILTIFLGLLTSKL